jgi:hypothetical protein
MSRPIEFRAWHEVSGEYRTIQFIDLINKRYQFTETDYWVEGINGEWPEGRPPEQFTGRHDKNGKKVFEGDLVEWVSTHNGATKSKHKDAIEWQLYGWMLMPHCHELYAAEMEVIGTIHDKGNSPRE